jgi:hypothetical protein
MVALGAAVTAMAVVAAVAAARSRVDAGGDAP